MIRSTLRIPGVLALFLTVSLVQAQPTLPVQVEVDNSSFFYDENQSLAEIYLAFGIQASEFEKNAEGVYQARFPLHLQIVPAGEGTESGTSEPAWQNATQMSFVIPDTAGLSQGQYFVHQVRAVLKPGDYELRLLISGDEAKARREIEYRKPLVLPDFNRNNQSSLSDLTLATSVSPSDDREDPFYKNGLSVRPNANQLFGQGIERLFYYVEAYNAGIAAGADNEYTVQTYVTRANSTQPVSGFDKSITREARSPDVLVGTFDVSTLASGSYELRVALLGGDNQPVAEQSKKFFVYNPSVAQEQNQTSTDVSFESSEFAIMPEDQVNEAMEYIQIIATDSERKRMRSIKDLDERRRFLMEFWQKRNPTPGSTINTFREEFYRRIRFVNERYGESYTQGWKSDRGRVIVKYGSPTAIDPHLYDAEYKPHEIWQYDNIPGEGQAIFVFADRNGFGQFELIHSTVSGERTLSDWQFELRR